MFANLASSLPSFDQSIFWGKRMASTATMRFGTMGRFLAPIGGLLFVGGPSAVIGRISHFVFDALQGVATRRAKPHVGQKVGELAPALAHGYTPAAIASEAFVVRVRAALNHPRPHFVLFELPHSMSGVSHGAIINVVRYLRAT